ncbi:hypothetical protein Sjap_010494 [Stephania japonica]|uniref:C2H2-type domain-containing protein n=1 Tax=Stephania japonica TaxID=461633 RepID=A0AAP0JBQ7_9MAGN
MTYEQTSSFRRRRLQPIVKTPPGRHPLRHTRRDPRMRGPATHRYNTVKTLSTRRRDAFRSNVEACDFCGECFHPTYACPYHPRYGNHHSSSYASPQPDFCMSRPSPRSPQQERRTIKDMEKNMISDWLSPSTKKYSFDGWSNSSYQQDTYSSMRNQPSRDIIRFLLDTEQDMNLTEQELDQWIEQRDQEVEEEINSILQKISAETMSAIPLESVEMNEATPIEDDWSKPEEIIEVSLHERDISIAQDEAEEAEKEIDVILERRRNRKMRARKTNLWSDDDAIDSYVLEVLDELLHMKEGMYDELPKSIDAPFVFDILILVLNLEDKVWDKFGGVLEGITFTSEVGITRRWSCWKEDFKSNIFFSHKHHEIRTRSSSKLQYKLRPELQFENHAVSPIRLRHIATAVDLPTDTCASPALSVLMRMKFALSYIRQVSHSPPIKTSSSPLLANHNMPQAYHHFHPMRGCHVAINSQL